MWSGRPGQGVRFSSSDIFLVPFSLMWGGFAIFWESIVFSQGGPIFMKLWGIPFVAIGLYLIAGRFFWDAYVRSHMIYAVTTQRLLVKNKKNVSSHSLKNLPQINLSEATGTIDFGTASLGGWNSRRSQPWTPSSDSSRFVFLANASEVYQTIVRAQQSA